MDHQKNAFFARICAISHNIEFKIYK